MLLSRNSVSEQTKSNLMSSELGKAIIKRSNLRKRFLKEKYESF